MDEHQAQGMIRRRRSRAETEQVVSAYESSGLSRVEYCQQQGLSLATLARYRRQQRQQGEAATGNRWLAVEVSGVRAGVGSETASGLAVALACGRRIEVGRGFDAPTLVQLPGVLEGR